MDLALEHRRPWEGTRESNFLTPTYADTVWHRVTKFGMLQPIVARGERFFYRATALTHFRRLWLDRGVEIVRPLQVRTLPSALLYYINAPPQIGGALRDAFVWPLTSVCLSVAYIGPKSRIERPRKIKIGTEIAHVTRDSDTTFKIKRSKVKVTRPLYSARP